MTNVLIRGLSDAAVERIDAEANAQGLSRNEYLRRALERGVVEDRAGRLRPEDWRRTADAFADLADPEVMDAAWR